MTKRIIGKHTGQKKGPLLFCIGGIHGNERAGILAIQEVLSLLEMEILQNPGFQYNGTFIGLCGNLPALDQQKRFIDRDLNRMLTNEENIRISNIPHADRANEDQQTFELIHTIEEEIKKSETEFVLIIDLHTTTADGGIFTISSNDPLSRDLAMALHAPVILGIAEDLKGTTIAYFNKPHKNQYCVVFEAGQHDDPECVHRSVAAIISAMKKIGSVDASDVNIRHEKMLVQQSAALPKLTKLIYHYKINEGENFHMLPGYENFQPVMKGEQLAINNHGPIYAPSDGLILMPKYQSQGEDGFFLVEVIEN